MKVTTIITLLFISSCAFFSHHQIDEQAFEYFPQNKKALIIFKLSSAYPSVEWCKYRESETDKSNNCINIKSQSNYQILLVEPGKYEVASYDKISYRYRFTHHKIEPSFSNITHKRRSKPIMVFEAWPSKINYLGDIKLNDYSVGSDRIIDEFEDLFKNLDFSNYKYEYNYIQNHRDLIVKNLAKTKLDLSEEIKVKKDREKTFKKKLKDLTKKKKNPKSKTGAKLKNYEN